MTDPGLATKYTGITKTGGLYNLSGSLEYQAAPQLFLGGMAGFNNARDFQERIGGVYLRYAFSRETTRLYSPPGTLRFNTPQY